MWLHASHIYGCIKKRAYNIDETTNFKYLVPHVNMIFHVITFFHTVIITVSGVARGVLLGVLFVKKTKTKMPKKQNISKILCHMIT